MHTNLGHCLPLLLEVFYIWKKPFPAQFIQKNLFSLPAVQPSPSGFYPHFWSTLWKHIFFKIEQGNPTSAPYSSLVAGVAVLLKWQTTVITLRGIFRGDDLLPKVTCCCVRWVRAAFCKIGAAECINKDLWYLSKCINFSVQQMGY